MSRYLEEQQMRLDAMQDGREAVAMMGLIRPYVDTRIHHLVHQLAARYRSGQADLPALLGIAAQISGLMDLLSDLDTIARRGDIAATKELEDGRSAGNA